MEPSILVTPDDLAYFALVLIGGLMGAVFCGSALFSWARDIARAIERRLAAKPLPAQHLRIMARAMRRRADVLDARADEAKVTS